jgi:hypothetical protein
MTDQDAAINKVIVDIFEEITKWKNKRLSKHETRCCKIEYHRGFHEGLRLGGAIVLARRVFDEVEEEETE